MKNEKNLIKEQEPKEVVVTVTDNLIRRNIAEIMRAKNIEKTDLAKKLGWSLTQLRRYMIDNGISLSRVAGKIAEALEVGPNSILVGLRSDNATLNALVETLEQCPAEYGERFLEEAKEVLELVTIRRMKSGERSTDNGTDERAFSVVEATANGRKRKGA